MIDYEINNPLLVSILNVIRDDNDLHQELRNNSILNPEILMMHLELRLEQKCTGSKKLF